MKAIVYDGIQKVQYREVPDPKIEKDDDIIVKVTSTAICGSDLHLVHGLVKGMYDGFENFRDASCNLSVIYDRKITRSVP